MTASDLSVAKNGRKGKNWKVYLFEFILLFLAVTLGFLADNFRESLSQQARAKTLLEALKTDLKADTLELTANIRFYQNSVVALDSLYEMLLMPPQDVDRSAYYRQLQKSILLVIFTPSKNATEQLQSERLLSLLNAIKNKLVLRVEIPHKVTTVFRGKVTTRS